MGRGRIEIKRIEDNTNRQVTFCKRRMGLIKKARELSILCDADVALLVVSTYGRVYKFASSKDLEHILNEACNNNKITTNGELHGINPDPINAAAQPPHLNNLNSTEESLRRRLEELQKELRLMNGEVKEICNIKQLVKLEAKIKHALQKVNKHKFKVCSKELGVLRKKHRQLEKENKELRMKIDQAVASEPSADELSMTSNNSALQIFNECDIISHEDEAVHTLDSGDQNIFLELRLMG